MSELDKELAKIYLEQQGFLTALDVPMEEEGVEAPGFDVLGVEIVRGMVSQAVAGTVVGWWHSGSYLTPGLIRAHLESDRRFLSESFSPDRIQYIRNRFGLGPVPVRNVLFYSQRSPGKSTEAERMLGTMNIEVVYLEDIILDALPKVGSMALGEGTLAQVLTMVRYSRLFREMRRALAEAEQCKVEEEDQTKPAPPPKPKRQDPQLDFMQVLKTEGMNDGEPKDE